MPAELRVEILAYAPTAFFQCRHCEVVFAEAGVGREIHDEQLHAGLPPEMAEEYGRLSGWVHDLVARHGDRVAVDVIDVASIRGFWRSLRHGVRRYPAVIVGGRTFGGGELGAAAEAVERRLPAA